MENSKTMDNSLFIHTDGFDPFKDYITNYETDVQILAMKILFVGLYDYPYGYYKAYVLDVLDDHNLVEIKLSEESFNYCDAKTDHLSTITELPKPEELKEFTIIVVCNNGEFTILK